MKGAFLFCLSICNSPTIFAQNHLIIGATKMEVHYRHSMQRDTVRRPGVETDSMILRIGATASQFFSRHTFYNDSLWSDPDGRALAEELTLEAFRTGNHAKMPQVPTTHDYLYKGYPAGRSTVTSARFYVSCRYEEDAPTQQWTLADSTRTVLGHRCRQATCDFRGRRWTAWFAPDIPVSDGPWKLGGLPGLILEAYDRNDDYHYTATRIRQERDLPPVTLYNFDGAPFLPTDRLTFLRAQRDYLSGYGDVYEIDLIREIVRSGRRKTYMQRSPHRLLYDFLERDYGANDE